jgi:8-oxo-dGTP pyrophosphatase MutT (NUDIX family)
LRIGALREAFEESGLLLARPSTARGVGALFCEGAAIETMGAARAAIDRGEESFLEHCRAAGLVLALDALAPFAHWITPKGMPKRFDTMFYCAIAPESQRALCDGREAVDACWMTPQDALEAGRDGRRKIIFPTRLNLERLAMFDSATRVLAACTESAPVTIEPQILSEDGVMVLRIPENAGYVTTRELLDNAI